MEAWLCLSLKQINIPTKLISGKILKFGATFIRLSFAHEATRGKHRAAYYVLFAAIPWLPVRQWECFTVCLTGRIGFVLFVMSLIILVETIKKQFLLKTEIWQKWVLTLIFLSFWNTLFSIFRQSFSAVPLNFMVPHRFFYSLLSVQALSTDHKQQEYSLSCFPFLTLKLAWIQGHNCSFAPLSKQNTRWCPRSSACRMHKRPCWLWKSQ